MTPRLPPTLCALFLLAAPAPAAARPDFSPLQPLLGKWEGEAKGDPGTGTASRDLKVVLDGRFIEIHGRSSYPPGAQRREGEAHEDVGFLGRDDGRKRFVLRLFHGEGSVEQYLAELSADGRTLVMTTEAMENMPAGWKARLTWSFPAADQLVETYEIAAPGGPFTKYTEIRYHRPGRGGKKPR